METAQADTVSTDQARVTTDRKRNLLTICYRGAGSRPAAVVTCLEAVRSELQHLQSEFKLLVDLTDLQSMDLGCATSIGEIMDVCNAYGVAIIIRIIPEPSRDIGLQIMSLFHYRNNVQTITCSSAAEANKVLAEWVGFSEDMSQTNICQICNQARPPQKGEAAELIRPSLHEFIRKQHPQWDGTGFVCFDHIAHYRSEYVKEVLKDELGELSELENEVVENSSTSRTILFRVISNNSLSAN